MLTLEQRSVAREGNSQVDIWGKNILARTEEESCGGGTVPGELEEE